MIVAKKYYPVVYETGTQYVMVELPNGTKKTLGDSAGYKWGSEAKATWNQWGGAWNQWGGARLAYAILKDFSNSAIADRRYVNFTVKVIDDLPPEDWIITGQSIIDRYPEDFAEYELENILDAIGSVGK